MLNPSLDAELLLVILVLDHFHIVKVGLTRVDVVRRPMLATRLIAPWLDTDIQLSLYPIRVARC